MPNPPSLTRRTALLSLASATVGGLSGCTEDTERNRPRRGRQEQGASARLDPDVVVASLALASEQRVLDALKAAAERHRRLSTTLAPLVATHQAHIDLLADAVPDDAPSPTATALQSPSPAPSPGQPSVPATSRAALAALTVAEEQLGATMRRHAFVAESGQFARLLAAMSAAAAQHTAVLRSAEPVRGQR